jgi:hypothetical protein
LPAFITAPGETDVLFVVMVVVVIVAIVLIGVLYFRIHALPEHLAHRGEKIQYEIVCVLALLSLFTHNHIFWIIGLLLAIVPLPDFSTPLSRIADSISAIANAKQPSVAVAPPPEIESPSPPSPGPVPPKIVHVKERSHA